MSEIVGTPDDRFSSVAAHVTMLLVLLSLCYFLKSFSIFFHPKDHSQRGLVVHIGLVTNTSLKIDS